MALGTMTLIEKYNWGNRRVRVFDVQLTSGANYTTAGEPVTPKQAGMGRFISHVFGAGNSGAGQTTGYSVGINYTAVASNPGGVRLQGFVSNGASPALFNEAPSNTNLSAGSVRLAFVGQ
jgi:hypothetical protein